MSRGRLVVSVGCTTSSICSRIPRTIECELLGDVVDTCLPGDVVTVTGEVKVLSVDDYGSGKKDQSLFLLYILVNHVAKYAPCLPRRKSLMCTQLEERSVGRQRRWARHD